MEQHLTCLTGPANGLPFEIVTMSDLVGLMTFLLLRIDGSHGALLRSRPTKRIYRVGRKVTDRGSGPAASSSSKIRCGPSTLVGEFPLRVKSEHYLGYRGMFALAPKADLQAVSHDVRYVPTADIGLAYSGCTHHCSSMSNV